MATLIVSADGTGDYLDIQSALSATEPGDTVYIRSGDYSIPEGLKLNTPNVLVSGYPGDDFPKIHAPNDASGPLVAFRFQINSSGSTLQNVDISGGQVYAIKLETAWEYGPEAFGKAATNITIQNSKIHDSGRDCIKLTPNTDNVSIIGNEIYNSGRGGTTSDFPAANAEGIDAVNADNIVIKGNYIHDTATSGAYVKGGSKNALIEDNLIKNTGISTAPVPNSGFGIATGYGTDAEYHDSDNTDYIGSFDAVIRNNVIINTLDSGVLIAGAHNTQVINNTMLDVGGVEANNTRWYLGGVSVQSLKTYTGASSYVVTQSSNPVILGNIISVAASTDYDERWADNDPLVISSGTVLDNARINSNVYWDQNGSVDFEGRSLEEHRATTGFDKQSEVVDVPSQTDENGKPLDGSHLATKDVGADGSSSYGANPDLFPTPEVDDIPPTPPVVSHSEEYATQYSDGVLVHWNSDDDVTYYNVYLDGELVSVTSGSGYYLRRDGQFELTIEAVDKAGNVSSRSDPYSVSHNTDGDTTPPTDPGTDEPDTDPGTDDPDTDPGQGDQELDFEQVDGIDGVAGIYIGSQEQGTNGKIVLKFEGKTYFDYTPGKIEILSKETGEVVFSVDPQKGDIQEGKDTFEIQLPDNLANGQYGIAISRMFARLEKPDGSWSGTEAMPKGQWEVNIGQGQAEFDFEQVDGIEGLAGIYIGSQEQGTNGKIVLKFEGKTYFDYTSGKVEFISKETGEVVFSVDPQKGDIQEGKDTFEIQLPDDLANGQYDIAISRMFARLEKPDGSWSGTEEMPKGQWEVSISQGQPDDTPDTEPDPDEIEFVFDQVDDVDGLAGIYVGSQEDGTQGKVVLKLEGKSYFDYTSGTVEFISKETGEVVFSVDPHKGDTQEGLDTFEIQLPDSLMDGQYDIAISRMFARLEKPDGSWGCTEAMPTGQWDIGDELTSFSAHDDLSFL